MLLIMHTDHIFKCEKKDSYLQVDVDASAAPSWPPYAPVHSRSSSPSLRHDKLWLQLSNATQFLCFAE